MARGKLPDPIQRRHWLERPMDAAKARAVAEEYLNEGREAEAVAFLAKAEDPDALEALAGRAADRGDVFVLKQACAALGREPTASEWRRAADAAESAGLVRYASTARRQVAGDGS